MEDYQQLQGENQKLFAENKTQSEEITKLKEYNFSQKDNDSDNDDEKMQKIKDQE